MSVQASFFGIFRTFLVLGCTSFGGPVAHIGFFRRAFVDEREWLDDQKFSDLLALCQFIPGPASSQLGMAIGYQRLGYLGAFAAWLGFTLPSAVLLALFAWLVVDGGTWLNDGVIQGLKLVAVAVVLHAFMGMHSSLAPDASRMSIMLLSAIVFLFWTSAVAPLVVLGSVALVFGSLNRNQDRQPEQIPHVEADARKRFIPLFCLTAFFFLLILPMSGMLSLTVMMEQFFAYVRSGALVFGGGHVVLPLLETEFVERGWIGKDQFLAGYGAAQAVPGPLFTFASFLGVSQEVGFSGLHGAIIATVAIFLPSFLLLFGVLPFWDRLRSIGRIQSALWAVNASVVGLLLAALYDPVIKNSIVDARSAAFAATAYIALVVWRLPVAWIVFVGAIAGMLIL